MASGKVQEYTKTIIDPTKKEKDEYDQLQTAGPPKITTSQTEINKNCELQLDQTNFEALKGLLKLHLTYNLERVKKSEDESLERHKKNIKAQLTDVEKQLKSSAAITNLNQEINEFNAGNVYAEIEKSTTLDNQKELLAKLKKTKGFIKSAKDAIDKLQGSVLTKGVFGKIEDEIETMRTRRVLTKSFINNIDLTIKPNNEKVKPLIKGMFYQNRWSKGVKCTVARVNAVDKVYTIAYYDTDNTLVAVKVNQSQVCLVNEGQFVKKQ